ncbi:MAG: hypothetical protein LGB55_07280, partial [Sulfurovum sp.]|nr:hypothetical protein [Sulfurovum sp.]
MKKIMGLLLFLATTVCVFATDDHGNNTATATRINPNSTTAGSIEVAGDNDYFKIETTGKGLLIVYTTGSTDTYGYI